MGKFSVKCKKSEKTDRLLRERPFIAAVTKVRTGSSQVFHSFKCDYQQVKSTTCRSQVTKKKKEAWCLYTAVEAEDVLIEGARVEREQDPGETSEEHPEEHPEDLA